MKSNFSGKRSRSMVFSERLEDQVEHKLIIFMVGLPARGKSYIAKKLRRWLNWMGLHTRVFNVGNARRKIYGAGQDCTFFDPTDPSKSSSREQLALAVLEESLQWLRSEGSIAIHDATNSTTARREKLLEYVKSEPNTKVIFIESICHDKSVLDVNIQMKTQSPDYISMDPDAAKTDFLSRLQNYAQAYETIPEDSKLSYIKVIDVGTRVIANRINGYLDSQIVFYLMNIHIMPRSIYLVLHGENEYNVTGRIGGDSHLTPTGEQFALELAEFVKKERMQSDRNSRSLEIWTSTQICAVQTAQYLKDNFKTVKNRNLNALFTGACSGMTEKSIQELLPEEYNAHLLDKLAYRYPGGGESYLDVVDRAKSLIIELERMKNDVMIISHRAVLRVLYSYFMDIPLHQVPHIDIPLHTIIHLTPTPHGCEEKRVKLHTTNPTESTEAMGRLGAPPTWVKMEEGAKVTFSVHYETRPGEVLRLWLCGGGDTPWTMDPAMTWSEGHYWHLDAIVPQHHRDLTFIEYNYVMVNELSKLTRREDGGTRQLILPPWRGPLVLVLKDSWGVVEKRDYSGSPSQMT